MKPLYSGRPWDVANWPLYKGGLIIQCTFNREVLFGTLLGGCFRQVSLYNHNVYPGDGVLSKLLLVRQKLIRSLLLTFCCILLNHVMFHNVITTLPTTPETRHT